ncbi:hypothetical protein P59_192 [Bacillus phage P59]|nr:hypothetical protein P59_192 [Bacillus phage P59]
MEMDYSNYTDKELLQKVQVSGLHDVDVNEEWYRRHGMNLPYMLNSTGRIINFMTLMVVRDSECDRLIREQANKVRTHRQLGK